MPTTTIIRRSAVLLLIVLGAALMFLTLETWAGLGLLLTGATVELIGHALEP